MKKLILLLLQVILCSVVCKAQTPTWLWAVSSTGGDNYQYGSGAAIDDSGYFYMGGRFAPTCTFGSQSISTGAPSTQFFGKFDENGNCLWLAQQFYSYGEDYPRGFCIDRAKNNNVYATGNISSGDGMYVVKFNNAGKLQWSSTLGTSSFSGYEYSPNGDGIAADTAGNVYVTGETGGGSYAFIPTSGAVDDDSILDYPGTGASQEMFLTKLDKNGNFLWAVGADGTDAATDAFDVGRSVALGKSGPYVFVGGGYYGTVSFHSRNPSSFPDIIPPTQSGSNSTLFIAKYDTAGDIIWVSTAPGAGIPWTGSTFTSSVGASNSIAIDSCDDVFVTSSYSGSATFGPFTLTALGPSDGYVASCNSNGQWQWVDDIGGSGSSTSGASVALDKDNDVYVGGGFTGTVNFGSGVSATASSGGGDAFIVKYANSNGAAQWVLSPSGSGASGGGSVAVDNNKFVYFTGSYSGTMTLGSNTVTYTGGFGQGIYIAKLDTVPALYIVPKVSASYCAGETTTIPYTITGTFNSGNTFTAELSDSTGSFVNYTILGTVTSSTSGAITITIPAGITQGSTYLVRVVSSSPATSSYVNGCGAYYQPNVYVDNFYVSIGTNISVAVSPVDTNLCSGGAVKLSAGGTGLTYKWSIKGDTTTLSKTDTFTVNPTTTTTYYVAISNGTCSGIDSVEVSVNSASPLAISITPASGLLCHGTIATIKVDKSGTNYNWTPSVGLSATIGDSIIANPSITTTYTVTGNDSLGCAVSDSVVVTVDSKDTLIILPQPPPSFCSGSFAELQVSSAGINATYNWSPSTGLSATTGDSVLASPTVTITYTITGNDSLGCAARGTEKVDVFPAPITPTFTQNGNTLKSSAQYQNQWYLNGEPLTGDTSQYLAITVGGEYWVSVTNEANGCSSASDSASITAGINQLSVISDQLSIYPNPFNGTIFIKINSSAQDVKDWNLQITDVLGRTVYSKQSLDYSNDIDLSNLSSGVYFITVINKTGRAVFPVVRQN